MSDTLAKALDDAHFLISEAWTEEHPIAIALRDELAKLKPPEPFDPHTYKPRSLERIGCIAATSEGTDTYMLLTPDQDGPELTQENVEAVLTALFYTNTHRPGGIYTAATLAIKHPYSDRWICCIQHRYDV